MFLSIEKERKKHLAKRISSAIISFAKCMTGLRTDVRTYGHDVITKFSELHGLLPFSLTNGCSASGFRPLELR